MIVSISNINNIEDKLKSILDNALVLDTNHIVIMVDKNQYESLISFMSSHKKIEKIKMVDTLFIVKQMRIEVKPIDFYI